MHLEAPQIVVTLTWWELPGGESSTPLVPVFNPPSLMHYFFFGGLVKIYPPDPRLSCVSVLYQVLSSPVFDLTVQSHTVLVCYRYFEFSAIVF